MTNVWNALLDWNGRSSERQKLQHIYVLLIAFVTVVAGLVSLLNADWGRRLMYAVLALVTAFVINGIVWHLLHSIVIERLDQAGRQAKRSRS